VVDEMIDSLCEGDTLDELRELLSTIPTELGELYTRTLRRRCRASSRVVSKYRYEEYVMFQIATYALTPLSLYDLWAVALFITTGKEPYPNFERLSEDQMERRLYSRSAGLLEATGGYSAYDRPVQFIRQTVKEFVLTGEGSEVIQEAIADKHQESGYSLIFRYLCMPLWRLCCGFIPFA
jgi:hypothetical protein